MHGIKTLGYSRSDGASRHMLPPPFLSIQRLKTKYRTFRPSLSIDGATRVVQMLERIHEREDGYAVWLRRICRLIRATYHLVSRRAIEQNLDAQAPVSRLF
ncbi:hypothetical protein M422DRAFT_31163 [Sphaerobolus stellatus SS14]|uniref:Uncharacterized protein n=1 Tax=Sphaerobolus stellatus (strain SS14) TaxID=990650 RepID=A0A0C9V787_SPHS4|nr:hypothetical protein M422DRAFT_31163 [Sphaerobolus stellatus SS14]